MVASALRAPGFCWGDDGHQKPWPSTCFISSSIVRSLGYMVPPSLKRGYFDVVWVQLAAATKTARTIPAMFRHQNLPPGHPDGPSAETIAADGRAYADWLKRDSKRDISRVTLATFF